MKAEDFVKEFQRRTGLAADGDPGPLTMAALDRVLLPPVPATPVLDVFDQKSELKLVGVQPDLVKIIRRAREDSPIPFIITEGLRSVSRQKQLVASGASTTMRSRHLTGHAVDVAAVGADGAVMWDWPLYERIAGAVKQAAASLHLQVEWGGDWHSFKDGPHFQLPWTTYP